MDFIFWWVCKPSISCMPSIQQEYIGNAEIMYYNSYPFTKSVIKILFYMYIIKCLMILSLAKAKNTTLGELIFSNKLYTKKKKTELCKKYSLQC